MCPTRVEASVSYHFNHGFNALANGYGLMICQLSGNSRILLTVDAWGSWEQLYYPYPGLHQQCREVRLGLYDVDEGRLEWVDQPHEAPVQQGYVEDSNITWTRSNVMGVELAIDNMVHPDLDMVIRRVRVRNGGDQHRRLRLFHYQSLQIAGSPYRDTAYWDPSDDCLHHYKRSYHFAFYGHPKPAAYSCGEHTLKGLEGSHVDAQDGALAGHPVSHGAADSILQWDLEIPPGGDGVVHLFVLIARSRRDAARLIDTVRGKDPSLFTTETLGYWNHWIQAKVQSGGYDLSPRVRELYRRSLLLLQHCTARNGAIIASPDATTLKGGGDGYEYCWWRDGALIASIMSEAGLHRSTGRFLRFARKCQEPDGSFLHRHFPDGYLGPTWHPPSFLQVDQTASVVDAVYRHYRATGDVEELLEHWELLRRGADFLMDFVDDDGLPKASYDLWEERKAVNAYSVGLVVRALHSASRVAQALTRRHEYWSQAAQKIRDLALPRLWDADRQTLRKSIKPDDETIDAATLCVDLFPPGDARHTQVADAVEKALWQDGVGGIARYQGDQYFGDENPWIICTLWLAQARLRQGDARRARELLDWTCARAGPGLMLPEQVDAQTGERRGVVPLVWSHAVYVETVDLYNRLATKDVGSMRLATVGVR